MSVAFGSSTAQLVVATVEDKIEGRRQGRLGVPRLTPLPTTLLWGNIGRRPWPPSLGTGPYIPTTRGYSRAAAYSADATAQLGKQRDTAG